MVGSATSTVVASVPSPSPAPSSESKKGGFDTLTWNKGPSSDKGSYSTKDKGEDMAGRSRGGRGRGIADEGTDDVDAYAGEVDKGGCGEEEKGDKSDDVDVDVHIMPLLPS